MKKEKAALIVIDVQDHEINKHTKNLPRKIAAYIKANRRKLDLILFTEFRNKAGSNFFKQLHYTKEISLAGNSVYKDLSEFTTRNNVFVKVAAFSAFKVPKLVAALKKNHITKVYLCGLDAEACVLASAFDAFDLGYRVEVIEKLTKSCCGKKNEQAAKFVIKTCIQKTRAEEYRYERLSQRQKS